MDLTLVAMPALGASMLALAVASTPHCAVMCGMPCATVLARQPRRTHLGFHGARVAGYAVAGAVMAGGVGQLAGAASAARALEPLWLAWHMLGLVWGLWLLLRGAQPVWIDRRRDEAVWRPVALPVSVAGMPGGVGAPSMKGSARGPLAAVVAGLVWVAWPCGMLQSALLVASLSNQAASGALLMGVFAAITSLGLVAAPGLWRKLSMHGPLAIRLAGLALAASCLWAFAHRSGFVDWCLSA
jgi:uncharacterized protein